MIFHFNYRIEELFYYIDITVNAFEHYRKTQKYDMPFLEKYQNAKEFKISPN
mgnify:CR=1 FL=1